MTFSFRFMQIDLFLTTFFAFLIIQLSIYLIVLNQYPVVSSVLLQSCYSFIQSSQHISFLVAILSKIFGAKFCLSDIIRIFEDGTTDICILHQQRPSRPKIRHSLRPNHPNDQNFHQSYKHAQDFWTSNINTEGENSCTAPRYRFREMHSSSVLVLSSIKIQCVSDSTIHITVPKSMVAKALTHIENNLDFQLYLQNPISSLDLRLVRAAKETLSQKDSSEIIIDQASSSTSFSSALHDPCISKFKSTSFHDPHELHYIAWDLYPDMDYVLKIETQNHIGSRSTVCTRTISTLPSLHLHSSTVCQPKDALNYDNDSELSDSSDLDEKICRPSQDPQNESPIHSSYPSGPGHSIDLQNYLSNPSFEDLGTPPYSATTFGNTHSSSVSLRRWSHFYNGGYIRKCGMSKVTNSDYIYPLHGNCFLMLGSKHAISIWERNSRHYFGAHQDVKVPTHLAKRDWIFSIWYVYLDQSVLKKNDDDPTTEESANIKDTEYFDPTSFSLEILIRFQNGRVAEGITIPLNTGISSSLGTWRQACVHLKFPRENPAHVGLEMIHVFTHLHRHHAVAFFDSAFLGSVPDSLEESHCQLNSCHSAILEIIESTFVDAETTKQHLVKADQVFKAVKRPCPDDLTLAVPLTANRMGRLDEMSRIYRGPIVTSVLVETFQEFSMVYNYWSSLASLHYHVDIDIAYRNTEEGNYKPSYIPINALRNRAVSLVNTTYYVMLDVDMIPSSLDTFACLNGYSRGQDKCSLSSPSSSLLSTLLPKNGDPRALVIPVMILDVDVSPPRDKQQLKHWMKSKVSCPYCLNSQLSITWDRWIQEDDLIREVAFTTDFEPYCILRKDQNPPDYDERFITYGFNKIAWTWKALARGYRFFVMPDMFLIHFNHLDNEWVQNISKFEYLKTWRRYLAYVAETVQT